MSKFDFRLDKGYQEVAKLLADLRYSGNRVGGISNGRIGPQSDELTDLQGVAGELAFCAIANICPDLSISPRRGGADCINRKGYKIDVKTTKYEHGHLVATIKTPKDAVDIYVMMAGEFPEYRLVGWATSKELIQKDNETSLGHGLTYALPYEKLHKPPSDKGS